ncbi:SCO3374 family protein [Streptomyces sp. UG1]|uniref:SCO3374 family protein n=1 Tax=Streptomyces sp. UG1 TaxID=3417652 RepID=UPI003CF8659C
MVGTRPTATTRLSTDRAAIPLPRRPLDPSDRIRRWYENELGWPVVPALPGSPPSLRTGRRFDVLDVPAEAGRAALRHLTPHSPVAVRGDRMRLLVAAGAEDEVPGVLRWLEWGDLPLDLRTLGEGDLMEAPVPPGHGPPEMVGAPVVVRHAAGDPGPAAASARGSLGAWGAVQRPVDPGDWGAVRHSEPVGPGVVRPLALGRCGAAQGAAVWLRPPEPGGEVEASLPTLSALGGGGGAPDLVRVLDTVATQCHRLRLRRACARPSACP